MFKSYFFIGFRWTTEIKTIVTAIVFHYCMGSQSLEMYPNSNGVEIFTYVRWFTRSLSVYLSNL
jgi:hypothetical protein